MCSHRDSRPSPFVLYDLWRGHSKQKTVNDAQHGESAIENFHSWPIFLFMMITRNSLCWLSLNSGLRYIVYFLCNNYYSYEPGCSSVSSAFLINRWKVYIETKGLCVCVCGISYVVRLCKALFSFYILGCDIWIQFCRGTSFIVNLDFLLYIAHDKLACVWK